MTRFVPPASLEVSPTPFVVSSLEIERRGGHEHIKVYSRGALAGTIVLGAGEGVILAERVGLVSPREARQLDEDGEPDERTPMSLDILKQAFAASCRWEDEDTPLEERLDETIGREHRACYALADHEELVARFRDLVLEARLSQEAAGVIVSTVHEWAAETLRKRGV